MKTITTIILALALLTGSTGAQTRPEKAAKPLTPRKAAMQLLSLANKISDSEIEGKDEIAEMIEMLSAQVLKKNRTWLCGTDTECAKLEAKISGKEAKPKPHK